MVGTGSVDLWVKADAPDVDLQVTLSEVRPDGQEVLVQSGWLRASQRQVAAASATALRPLHTHLERDVRPLPRRAWNEARVEIFPFAHAFRAGSRSGSRRHARRDAAALEVRRARRPAGTQVQIGIGADHASRVVLPVVPGVPVPRRAAGVPVAARPALPSLPVALSRQRCGSRAMTSAPTAKIIVIAATRRSRC